MMDSFRNPQIVLLIGGTSDIGIRTIEEMFKNSRLKKIIVTSQNEENLELSRKRLSELKIEIEGRILDLEQTHKCRPIIEEIFQNNNIDLCIIASGFLPNNEIASVNTDLGIKTALINYVGPLEVSTTALNAFRKQGGGILVLFSSAATFRARKDVFNYGAAKSALDHWAVGFTGTLTSPAIKILLVRSGMVRTKMSKGLIEAPFTIDPEDVAKLITKSLARNKTIIWVPNKLKIIKFILVNLPNFIFKRIKVR
jgi:decaprenylphospho-beta-D-erythro-pentofuranosid-2-ulose 2-reductase